MNGYIHAHGRNGPRVAIFDAHMEGFDRSWLTGTRMQVPRCVLPLDGLIINLIGK